MANDPSITFNRAAVQPMVCLNAGFALIKGQYWLFLGMALVGMLIGSAVPLGILMGPMMCGLFWSFFQVRRGQQVEFGNLFKGFDFFGQSVIATLLHMVPIMAIVIPAFIVFYVGFVLAMISQQGNDPSPGAAVGFLFALVVFVLFIMLVVVLISIGFTFVYPLIVDRGLPGFDAVKLSFKAAFANFWPLLGLILLNALLNLAGALLCIVGVYLVLPIGYAALAVAYEQVFGLGEPVANLPPPPPIF
jgi:uncharacterized membrane protein